MKPEAKEPNRGNSTPPETRSYYQEGIFTAPDPHRVLAINNLSTQHDRARQAVLYALELTGLYTSPTAARARVAGLKAQLDALPKEGDAADPVAVSQRATQLRAQLKGEMALLGRITAVEAEVSTADATYSYKYFDRFENNDKPILNVDRLEALYDRTDAFVEGTPFLQIIGAMHELDSDSRHQADRLGRILLEEAANVAERTVS